IIFSVEAFDPCHEFRRKALASRTATLSTGSAARRTICASVRSDSALLILCLPHRGGVLQVTTRPFTTRLPASVILSRSIMHSTLNSAVPFHVGIALKGTGFHPASGADPAQHNAVFNPEYWAQLTQTAETAGADFVSFEDSLAHHQHGQFDASLVASWVAPQTTRIGLLPTLTVTHTEPFHVSKNVATLDHISKGRAGWQVQISPTTKESKLFGRGRNKLDLSALYGEAQEAVAVVRKLWDSWEDDAEIRDAASGRFIDRNKLYYIDHVGDHFSIKGPSITPRPPQGQPVVAFSGRHDTVLKAA